MAGRGGQGRLGGVALLWRMLVEDAVELARTRRGVKPLRVVLLRQRVYERDGGYDIMASHGGEPMPTLL